MHISFAGLLNSVVALVVLARQSMGGMSQTLAKVVWVAWVHKVLAWVKKKWQGMKFGVGETYDFMNFYYDSMKVYWFKLWF